MRNNPLVPAFYYYKFAEAISAPYTSLSAYTAGAIDSQGNIIKPERRNVCRRNKWYP